MSQPEPPQSQPEPPQGFTPQFQPNAPQGHAGQAVPPHPGHSPGAGQAQPLALPYQGPQQPAGPGFGPAPQFYNQGAQKPSKKLLWIGLGGGFAAGILTTLLAVTIGTAVGAAGGPSFQSAADDCNAAHTSGISVGDKGASITIDTKGEDDSNGASFDDAACILSGLDVPDHVISQIDDTSAMDGRQTASWEGVEASWTYHPDSGMKLILTRSTEK
jgi:hypothetical protein